MIAVMLSQVSSALNLNEKNLLIAFSIVFFGGYLYEKYWMTKDE
jgi:hypothetical protein